MRNEGKDNLTVLPLILGMLDFLASDDWCHKKHSPCNGDYRVRVIETPETSVRKCIVRRQRWKNLATWMLRRKKRKQKNWEKHRPSYLCLCKSFQSVFSSPPAEFPSNWDPSFKMYQHTTSPALTLRPRSKCGCRDDAIDNSSHYPNIALRCQLPFFIFPPFYLTYSPLNCCKITDDTFTSKYFLDFFLLFTDLTATKATLK